MGERVKLFEHWLFKMDGWFALSMLCLLANIISLGVLSAYDPLWKFILGLMVFGFFVFFGVTVILLLSYVYISNAIGAVKDDYRFHHSEEKDK